MNNELQYWVQYLDSRGEWTKISVLFANYSEALDELMREAKKDPLLTHRIVRMEVMGYITGQGEMA